MRRQAGANGCSGSAPPASSATTPATGSRQPAIMTATQSVNPVLTIETAAGGTRAGDMSATNRPISAVKPMVHLPRFLLRVTVAKAATPALRSSLLHRGACAKPCGRMPHSVFAAQHEVDNAIGLERDFA